MTSVAVPAAKRKFYERYTKSNEWKAVRQRRLARAGYCCEHVDTTFDGKYQVRCQRRKYLTVHHLHYGSLGAEEDTDLEVLCWAHHMAHHLMCCTCRRCQQPVFVSIEDALDHVIMLAGDVEQHSTIVWSALPKQAEVFCSVSPLCQFCTEIVNDGQ